MENQNTDQQNQPDTVVVTSTDKSKNPVSSKSKKILFAVIGLAIIILLAEIGYFLFTKYNDSYNKPGPAELQERLIVPEGARPSQNTLELQQSRKTIEITKAQEFVGFLEEIQGKSEFLDNAVLNVIISGLVEEALVGDFEEEGTIYSHRLTLRSKEGNLHTFKFTREETDQATVFLISTEGTKTVDIEQINKDDTVVVDITTNLREQTPRRLLIRVLRK